MQQFTWLMDVNVVIFLVGEEPIECSTIFVFYFFAWANCVKNLAWWRPPDLPVCVVSGQLSGQNNFQGVLQLLQNILLHIYTLKKYWCLLPVKLVEMAKRCWRVLTDKTSTKQQKYVSLSVQTCASLLPMHFSHLPRKHA